MILRPSYGKECMAITQWWRWHDNGMRNDGWRWVHDNNRETMTVSQSLSDNDGPRTVGWRKLHDERRLTKPERRQCNDHDGITTMSTYLVSQAIRQLGPLDQRRISYSCHYPVVVSSLSCCLHCSIDVIPSSSFRYNLAVVIQLWLCHCRYAIVVTASSYCHHDAIVVILSSSFQLCHPTLITLP